MKLTKEQQQLFDENEILVYSTIKRRFANPLFHNTHGLSYDEIEQFGLMGLAKACKEFDSSRKVAFRSFVISNIVWSINLLSRQNSLHVINYQSFDLLDKTSLDKNLRADDAEESSTLLHILRSKERGYDEVEYEDLLNYVLESLPAGLSRVVELREKGMTYKEIGDELGVSHQAVRQRFMNNKDVIRELIIS